MILDFSTAPTAKPAKSYSPGGYIPGISAVSPSWGLSRVRDRYRLDLSQYRAAEINRLRSDWISFGDQVVTPSTSELSLLRNRSRDATRNDPVAAETALLESAPLTPVYFNSKIFLMSPRVRGWHEDGLWSVDFTAVSLAP